MSSVQEALKAREERKKKEQEESMARIQAKKDKIDSAVEAYKSRKKESAQSAISDLRQRLNSEIETIKKVSPPSWGSDSLRSTLDSTRESRIRVSNLRKELESYKNYIDEDTYNTFSTALDTMNDFYNSYVSAADVRSKFESEDDYSKWYEDYKRREAKKKAVLGADDFEEYSQKGASIENPTMKEAEGFANIFGWRLGSEDIENIVTYSRENADALRMGAVNNSKLLGDFRYSHMTDDEVGIYNYYLAKYGEDKANEYLKSIDDELDQREAGKMAEAFDDNVFLEALMGFSAGVETSVQGLKGLADYVTGNTSGTDYSANQYADQIVASNNEGILKGIHDVSSVIGGMTPSILASTITGNPLVGATVMGGSAMGNAYNEMVGLGYNKWQARGYGLLVGASETVLQYVLGGISKLGGKLTGNVIGKVVATLDNALARTAIQLGGNMASEGLEEAIQTILEPAFKALMTGEEFDAPKWEDIWYSALLGALSAGVLEGVPTIAGTTASSIKAKNIYGTDAQALITESLDIDPDNLHAQRMQAKLDKGKNVSGYQLNRLVEANETALVNQDTAKMKSAVEARLTELGEKGDISKLADVIVKTQSGGKLTSSERSVLIESKYGRRVSNELNPQSIESGDYTSKWAENIGTERINTEAYNKGLSDFTAEQSGVAVEEKTPSVTENPTVNENAVESEIEPLETVNNDEPIAENIPEVAETEEESTVSLAEASKKYGAQAQAMVHTYTEGQDVAKYDSDYKLAYDMGMSGVELSYVLNRDTISYITENQAKLAYEAGMAAADTTAKERDAKNKSLVNGKTGRRKGTVKGEGVTISDLKKTFNDPQSRAYKILSVFAEATGIDIVLYKSEANIDGDFEGAQGRFKWSDDKIYIDINAGLKNKDSVEVLAKYTMLRTFSHEFTHFIEKWNPIWYNEFRKAVFAELTARGEDVHALIMMKQNNGMSFEKASREVVAEAMTDILPDSHFVETLANEHKNIFEKLLEKLKEFLADLKAYFNTIGGNPSIGATALKDQVGDAVHYVESIVELFDKVAIGAVENYQKTVATDEVIEKPAKIESTDTIKADKDSQKGSETVKTTESENGYTITDDADSRIITIKFEGKPSNEVRTILKNNAFVWNRTSGEWFRSGKWYSKNKIDDVISALDNAYKADNPIDSGVISGEKNNLPYDIVIEKMKTTDTDTKTEDAAEIVKSEKKKPRTEEEKQAARKRQIGSEVARLLALSPERQKYLADKHNEYRSILEQLEKGDKLINDNGDVVGEVVNISDGCIFIVGEEGFVEMILPKSFTADGIIGTLEVGDGRFEKPDGTRITEETTESGNSDKEKSATEILRDMGGKAVSDNMTDVTDVFFPELAKKEEKPNVENVDNERPILESDTNGQRTPRLLDESQTADVPGTPSERNAVEDTRQRESETSRDGDRTDTADRLSRSEGNGEGRDLRELTEQETQAKSEELSETVEREIEQKSTEKPKGNNFVIGDSLNLPDGEKARFRANVDAIRLIKQLETEGRYATVAEQEILSKYVGWGGLSNAFGESTWNRETRRQEMVAKNGWNKEFDELRSLVDEGVITEQEYKDMSASTKNAHYTSIEVIKAMYDGLASLGFNGGRMLEPSSGVGNFVGAMPAEMSAKVNSWTMVELDRITGLIAKYLYPNSDVRIQGFETANIPDNYMDVAIGNVPFGNFGIVDRAYPKRITKAIHNYFFAKSIDKVRPGGIVMFITSSFTMNAKENAVRQYIMERADLLGAIRLPNTAFKGNAGTDVVTDILILKKRESGTEYAGEDFLEAEYDYNYGAYTSNYFKNHPEMVLGKAVTKRGMYGANTLTFEPLPDKGAIDDQIREAFKNIKGKMSYPTKPSPEKTNFAVERATKKSKSGGFVVHDDGSISRNENGQLVKCDVDEKTAKRIAGMLGVRDAYRNLANYLQQGVKEVEIKRARKELNAAYDKFVKEYGYLNSPANKKAISSDPDSYSILSLENYDAQKKTAKKADIFTKDTISANKTITHVDSVEEGVIASINLTGGVDVSLVAKLTDKSADDVTREIIDSRLAFKTRDNGLIARETYLSGNVRAKLREAESLAPYDKDFNNNIEELRKVIPTDIPYNEIYITPGATFIPNEIYADFIAHMLGGRNNPNSYSGPDVEVGRTASGEFKIVLNNKRLKGSYYNTQTWGTARKSFLELIDAMMGSRTVKVNDTVENSEGKKISVVNEAETEAANEKVKAIQKEFEDWIWKDEARRESLARLYNETFNAIVNPKYDGSHLSVNGINAEYSLREHQANAVHRIISSGGNTLLAHRVGAGKTLEMAAAAMKMRELGVIKKPVFVVPKAVVAQWGVEFHSYFPAARLLVADDKSFTPANRKIFTNKIANGDYDAVIVTYEQFEKIPMSAEYQKRFYEEQIDEIINAIAEEKAESRDGKGLTVKEMEKKKSQLEKKLKELTSKPKDENNVDFEMLGIDSLFVDEAHNFKNLEYVSKMSNVAGLGSTKGVQRAFDLFTKVRYLQEVNGGRGIVFATATPVMNSMVELYIMQRYLQPDVLNHLGLKSFDAWAKQFGEVVNKWEINPSGTGMRQKQVFANFRNLNELQLLFRSFADVLTEVPGLKIPKMKGGAVKIVECEPGEFQKNYMKDLQKRAENVKSVDPSVDNMLKITSDGRKVSYTQRMIDPTLPYEPECKIFKAAENVLKEYQDSADIKGTQIVFLDMATPKGTDKSKTETNDEDSVDDSYDEENARLYEDMRDYLVKKGIPKREIAFIHEADSDAKRKQLFEDVNNGKVRVLMGSTGKMGVGMNAQKRVVAIHHLDAPWRPGDVEQRDGRAFRQKNINDEVSKYVYVTKGSFDSRLWDILDRKQHFINQIMNGEDVGRTAEDTGEVTLSAAEVKAWASGNPLIEEQTKLTDEIKKLENLQKAYNSSIRLAKTKLSDDEVKITNATNRIARIREDIGARVDTYSEGKFSMTVGKQTFSDKKDAGAALAAAIVAKANSDSFATVGKFAGFEIRVIKNGAEYNGYIHGKESYKFNVYLNNTTRMVTHIGEVIAGFENMIKYTEEFISETTADRDAQKNILAQPFEKQNELDQKRARFNEVMELLAPKSEEQLGKMDDDTVQEQSRDYLEEGDDYGTGQDEKENSNDGRRTSSDVKEDSSRSQAQNGNRRGVSTGNGGIPETLRKRQGVAWRNQGIRQKEFPDDAYIIPMKNSPEENELKYLEQYNAEAYIVKASSWTRDAIAFVRYSIVYIKEDIPKKYQGKIAPHEATHLMMTEKYQPYLDFIEEMPNKIDMSSFETHRLLESISKHCEIDLGNIKNLHEVQKIYDEINATLYGYIGSNKIGQMSWNLRQIFYEPFQYIAEITAIHEQFKEDVKAEKEQDEVQYQQRTDTLTDREVLEMASNEIKMSDLSQAERDALTIFQDRLSDLKDLQEKRAEQGRLYKEQQFGAKVDRQAAAETLNRMQVLDGQIQKATADVLTVEEKEVLKRVLQKARKVVEVQERQHGQEILSRWRDRRKNADNIKKYRERLRKDVDELSTWIISPNNKDIAKHVPDVLKNSVIPFLSSINFMSKRSLKGGDATISDKEFLKRLDALKSAIKINIDVYGMYSGYNDLPADFMESLENFRKSAQSLLDKSAGEFIINQMTSDELKELSKVVRTLKKYIMQINRFHNNSMYQHVYEAGDDSIEFLKELGNAGDRTGAVSNFLFWQQIRPAYAFERFGKGGEAIYDGLRRGQAKLAFNTKEIERFTKKAYTDKEVKAWEDEIKTFSLGRDIVKMPVSYIMSFYELSKDPEALEHINGEGIRVATYTHDGKKISDVGHILTVGEFNQIIGSLTDRQKEVADNLQKYMAQQGGKWGNFVSVARFGEELFTNPKYFPINSDGRHLSSNVEEHPSAAALYALLNMSFTKSRKEGANNRIVIYSIFDVFANHMASMAQYNAMALPILDALKWFNYQQVVIDDEGNKTVIANVREQMDRVYGVPEETKPGSGKQGYAETFIVNIIKSFNGTAAQGTPYDTLGLKSLHRYNIAQVAYNLRVVLQQPLAITRAGMLVDYKSIMKGMKLKPSEIKKNIEEMQNYSGIAAWKSLGFYDVNISRGLTHLIKHDFTWLDKVGDVGMWGAEKADLWTWAAIWSACKEEVIKKQLATNGDFYEAVTKLFEDVIYKTQVVDSILTKNEFMRDKGTFARLVGSFMSEPTTNASMLIDAYDKYARDIQSGLTRRVAWQKNGQMIGRRLYVYAVGSVLLAAIQAAADALRDDDEYEEWYEKLLEAFGGNLVDELMPFNKLPILSDFYDLAKSLLSVVGVDTYGNPPQSVFMQWYDSLVKGVEIIHDKIIGEDTNYTWYGGIYKLLQAASGISGLPMASATREIITAWNNTIGAMAPSLKLKTYEPSELAQVRYAYEDGYLTDEEATEILLEKGLVDTENEAYFTIQGWEAGDGYSRYDAIYDAVLNGGDISAAMEELTSHGYTEEDVMRQVKTQIGKWYYDEESQVRITKQQAINMLGKYTDMDSDEITATVNEWSSVVVTGIKYDDIDDEFMEGNITASRAIEMYARYGSMSKEKATEKVVVLEFVKEYPECEGISYAAVNGYNTYCEPYGVPVNTYYEAWKHKNTLSGTVKEPMMAYINSLSLSARQKDSLYFAFGWKESTLWEAPWH